MLSGDGKETETEMGQDFHSELLQVNCFNHNMVFIHRSVYLSFGLSVRLSIRPSCPSNESTFNSMATRPNLMYCPHGIIALINLKLNISADTSRLLLLLPLRHLMGDRRETERQRERRRNDSSG